MLPHKFFSEMWEVERLGSGQGIFGPTLMTPRAGNSQGQWKSGHWKTSRSRPGSPGVPAVLKSPGWSLSAHWGHCCLATGTESVTSLTLSASVVVALSLAPRWSDLWEQSWDLDVWSVPFQLWGMGKDRAGKISSLSCSWKGLQGHRPMLVSSETLIHCQLKTPIPQAPAVSQFGIQGQRLSIPNSWFGPHVTISLGPLCTIPDGIGLQPRWWQHNSELCTLAEPIEVTSL